MAESFAFQFAGQLLGKLSSLAFREIGLVWGVERELIRLESTVTAIKSVLLDAAEQQATSRHVKDWLEKLQDVLYDVDDVLDDFHTEDLRRKVVIKGSKRKEVCNFFSSKNPLVFRVNVSHKMKRIGERLEDISGERKKFQFLERNIDTQVGRYTSREQTHSFVCVSEVIGRDCDKQKIVELLLSSTSTENNLSVLPIVGLGGLGKTTLAKLVYNDDNIVSKFEKRIWVCVSEDFGLKKLIENIIKDATGYDISNLDLDLNQLQTRLRDHLNSKQFLLVLDDVWNEDPKKWQDLRDLLSCGAQGSKIVVTTRSKTIAEIMGSTFEPYNLAGLSNDECMSIFVKCAFKEGREKEYPKLVEIGKAIVSKCGGLPLAVRSLGSLLLTTTEEREWVNIRDNDIWKISQRENDILPILKLSYDQMPLPLKQCFAFCSIYPKDVQIFRDGLIGRWIAQGFIPPDGSRRLEDIGNQYFSELISRSFFHDVVETFNCTVSTMKIHDLVHDLAISVADEVKIDTEVKTDTEVNSERTRHLLFCEENLLGEEFPHFLCRLNKVRSFSLKFNAPPISKSFLDTLIKTFKCLRMLELSYSYFEELPNSIGTLKHLRFLSLPSNKTIKSLPNSICNLLHLQWLNTYGCIKIQDFPRDFGNLRNLRYLNLTSQKTCLLEKGLEGLISLQTLYINQCCHLESLSEGIRHLTALRELMINECPRLTSLPGSMRYLTSLEKLSIGSCEKLSLLKEGMELQGSLNTLQIWELPTLTELPCGLQLAAATIKYLWIDDCPSFSTLPVWLNKCTSLSKLGVTNCRLLESLPLGMEQLTGLRNLYIAGCPDLSRKCERETGEYWPQIRHIPEICLE